MTTFSNAYVFTFDPDDDDGMWTSSICEVCGGPYLTTEPHDKVCGDCEANDPMPEPCPGVPAQLVTALHAVARMVEDYPADQLAARRAGFVQQIETANACPHCHGSGVVTDWVDYGSTSVPMETPCDCMGDEQEIPY